MNELTSSNFSIHYKPGAQNHVADTVSRFPIHKNNCISEYSELCDAGEINPLMPGGKRWHWEKKRSFWEDKVCIVIENLNCENITYEVQPEK